MQRQTTLNRDMIKNILHVSAAAIIGLILLACSNSGPVKETVASPTATSATSGDFVPTTGGDPAFMFEQLIQAVNTGNVAGATALFTDDVTWEGPENCEQTACSGKVEVQRNLEALVAAKPNWIRGGGQMQGDVGAFGLLDMSQAGQGNTSGALYMCMVQLQDGKIRALQIKKQQV